MIVDQGQIRRLHLEGYSPREIAQGIGCAKWTVLRHLAALAIERPCLCECGLTTIFGYAENHKGLPARERFHNGYAVNPDTGCWEWERVLSRGGYGRIKVRGEYVKVHRFAYELLVGPIPDGLHIDHLCRVRHCVNPAHLEPVTPAENTRRGNHTGGGMRKRTHCPQGHMYDEANTYRNKQGHRFCRTCNRERARRAAAPDRHSLTECMEDPR